MAKYIDLDALKKQMASFVPFVIDASNQAYADGLTDAYSLICQAPAADVVELKTGKNVATEYDDCDQFVCSDCGIELQDWHRVERDEDDGDNCRRSRTVEPTNADRIRAMTDEELAGFISSQIIDRNIGVPIEAWLDWLRQEAK